MADRAPPWRTWLWWAIAIAILYGLMAFAFVWFRSKE